ncbi:type-F conjugative transfer system secretin TraK [uncultured Umboniibacter sp.]|uniref:TraK domain-containing protein n=1 Tax=uncultured Umboniibacter sp. TaxID=1798917 RepID=UPI0026268D14|nr:type-F conjugative transfer system secretin TraK [uncultured Umboniibacter sp.]
MNRSLILLAIGFTTAFIPPLNAQDIPVVPAVEARRDLPTPTVVAQPPRLDPTEVNQALSPRSAPAAAPTTTSGNGPMVVTMEPGVNQILAVAINHLNRIVTPFESPDVTTTSSGTTVEVRDNVVYLGTTADEPVTLFITEKESEAVALNLTLIPRRIPSREITLRLTKSDESSVQRVSQRAKAWEESNPYLTTIESLLRTIALQQIPPGYTMASTVNAVLPRCRQFGLDITFGEQFIVGHNFIVHIGRATNNHHSAIEFYEDACGDWDIAAVAAFPNHALSPGQSTEVYVVQKRNYEEVVTVERASLIDQRGVNE